MTLYDKYDRSIFEAIRLKLVALGYMVDRNAYANPVLYKAAKEALRLTLPKERYTEVYGEGMWRGKSAIEPNMIIISRKTEVKGSIGAYPETAFIKKQNGLFDKIQYPRYTKTIGYDIRVITDSTYWNRELCSVIENVLPTEEYFQMRDPATGAVLNEYYLLMQTANMDMSSVEFDEQMYKYSLKDVYVTAPRVLLADIPPMVSVDFGIIVEPIVPGTFDSQKIDISVTPPSVP